MFFWLWLILLSGSAVLLEVMLGTRGIAIPGLLLTTFYFAVLRPWKRILFPFLTFGLLVDLLYGRIFPAHLLMVPLIILVAQYWRRHGDLRSMAVQCFPGMMVGLISSSSLLLIMFLQQGIAVLLTPRWIVLWMGGQILAGAILLPLLCRFGDSTARMLAVSRYSRVSPYQIQMEAYGKVEEVDHDAPGDE